MKITVAIDSFKGSISTFESARAVGEAASFVFPGSEIYACSLADGGEGTVDALVSATGGSYRKVETCNPLGSKIVAAYGIIDSGKTAVIEMSAAAGITLIEKSKLNPLLTTTYGVGEMIRDAIECGCRNFIIGIGGSATNDGGIGMLSALGVRFTDEQGNSIENCARGLQFLHKIDTSDIMPEIQKCRFSIACDVTNPLCGANGCSAIYGPQKGATTQMISDMDSWLGSYAKLTSQINADSDADYPGAGAAGGMGFAFMSYLGGELLPGSDIVIGRIGLEEYIKKSDIVVTGEGRLDGQSCMGKAPVAVARIAKKHNKPVIAFSGIVSDDAKLCNQHGIDAFFPILRTICTSDEAMNCENAYNNLKATAIQAFNLVKAVRESD